MWSYTGSSPKERMVMKTFLLKDEFQKNFGTILVFAVILILLGDLFRSKREAVEATESPVVIFQEEEVIPSLVGQSIDSVGEEINMILIHSDDSNEWGKVLVDDGVGNIAVGFNRREDLAVETEVLP